MALFNQLLFVNSSTWKYLLVTGGEAAMFVGFAILLWFNADSFSGKSLTNAPKSNPVDVGTVQRAAMLVLSIWLAVTAIPGLVTYFMWHDSSVENILNAKVDWQTPVSKLILAAIVYGASNPRFRSGAVKAFSIEETN